MGIITEGKAGTELQSAWERLEAKRGVRVIRADTGTLRDADYNAMRACQARQHARPSRN